MQSVSSRIWTRIAVSISYDDNHYTTGTTKIINNQLYIKLRQFTQEELNLVLRKIKNRKAAGLNEILPEVWKTRDFDNILLRL